MFRRPTKPNPRVSSTLTENAAKQIAVVREGKNAIECANVLQRKRARVVGEVKSMRIVPRGDGHWFEVVIEDGTGKINGWFFGRKKIAGMQLGSVVLFEGLVQLDQGEMTIANPYYELL